jgi:hypothetical protein
MNREIHNTILKLLKPSIMLVIILITLWYYLAVNVLYNHSLSNVPSHSTQKGYLNIILKESELCAQLLL